MKNKRRSENGKIKVLVIIIIVAIIVPAACFYTIMNGIVGTTAEFLSEAKTSVTELVNGLFKSDVVASMDTYIISNEQVEALKLALENVAIDTDVSGLTEIRLRKILMAHVVSTSLNHTICVVPVTQQDIVANLKEKEEYEDEDITENNFTDKLEQKQSKGIWPIDNPNYDLYYDSAKFFYFQDTENIFNGELRDRTMVFRRIRSNKHCCRRWFNNETC